MKDTTVPEQITEAIRKAGESEICNLSAFSKQEWRLADAWFDPNDMEYYFEWVSNDHERFAHKMPMAFARQERIDDVVARACLSIRAYAHLKEQREKKNGQ